LSHIIHPPAYSGENSQAPLNIPRLCLNINQKKTEVMRINARNNTPVQVNGKPQENVNNITHLGSIVLMSILDQEETRLVICSPL
jgi:hypothetical protein